MAIIGTKRANTRTTRAFTAIHSNIPARVAKIKVAKTGRLYGTLQIVQEQRRTNAHNQEPLRYDSDTC